MSATPESTLPNPEQRIADLERQLAEYRTERDEALAERAAIAEVLQVINSSPGDLAPIFEAILEKAHTLCGAAYGRLLVRDGEEFRLAAAHGEPRFVEAMRQVNPIRPPEGGPVARLVGGERIIHMPDARDDDFFPNVPAPIRHYIVDSNNIRTVLWVPLRKDGVVLGIITALRQEVRPFTDRQIALLESFAAQAVIAMENARLITETREALEQQTATAEVLQVINSSPGDLAPVFDAMLEKATGLCEAAFGVLRTWNGNHFHFAAAYGHQRLTEWARTRPPIAPEGGSPLGRIVGGEAVVRIVDAPSEYETAPGFREMVEISGMRSAITVALRKEDTLVGTLTVYRQEVRPFTDKQIALLQNFAAQAVIAMENARLLGELRERTSDLEESLEYQTATSDVLKVISRSTADVQPVLDTMVGTAVRLCGSDTGAIWIREGEVYRYMSFSAVKTEPEYHAALRQRTIVPGRDTSIAARVALEGRVVHVEDIRADPDYALPGTVASGRRTMLGVPLLRDSEPIGVIALSRKRVQPFTERQIELVRTFADQAVIAMENARLLGELGERTSDLEQSLEYQTATSDVLKVVSRSGTELRPALETLVETAGRICLADNGLIFELREGKYYMAASVGFSPEFNAHHLRSPTLPGRGTVTGRVAIERRVVHIEDARTDPEYTAATSQQLGLTRTMLGVPLLRGDTVAGVITLSRSRVEPFTEKQIALVSTFAAQAVIAIENARLLNELRQRTDEVAELNRGLEARVAEQVDELGRIGRLKRFLAPQLAELIVSQGDEKILESHRREIVVVFCDLRGYTAFTETAEPEEVLDFLREYHGALGPLVSQYEGTLDQFSGDGIMVFFNDPVPCPDPAERAVKMAIAMREAAAKLIADWRERGRDLGFGSGIAQGYATLGQIGFSERSGYTAIGTVCNVAARLCAEAKDGQILLSQRVNVALRGSVPTEQVGALTLKGLTQPVVAYNVPLAATQPALRVIEGGPQNV